MYIVCASIYESYDIWHAAWGWVENVRVKKETRCMANLLFIEIEILSKTVHIESAVTEELLRSIVLLKCNAFV